MGTNLIVDCEEVYKIIQKVIENHYSSCTDIQIKLYHDTLPNKK